MNSHKPNDKKLILPKALLLKSKIIKWKWNRQKKTTTKNTENREISDEKPFEK